MNAMDYVHVNEDVLNAVSNGWYHAPHDILGPHGAEGSVTIRVIRRLADSVFIETAMGRTEAIHEFNGIWRAVLPGDEVPDYRVIAIYGGVEHRGDDPYRFLPTLGEVDIYLFGEGRHEKLWNVLGSHVITYPSDLGDVTGTSFAVWAPNARATGMATPADAPMAKPTSRNCRLPDAPIAGESYRNAGSHYKVWQYNAAADTAHVENLTSGWVCTAHHPALYRLHDGSVELQWDYSTDGHFE